MRSYRRRLPHIDAPGMPTFVTWSLWGSLPSERVFEREHLSSGEAFVAWDRLLDTAKAQLRKIDAGGLCSLDAFVIMPNHLHLLCTPTVSIAELVRRVKGPTAHLANLLLGRTGEKFWQEEYFDRIVRNDAEFNRIRRYIEWNPVKAGFVAQPEQFPWSSAWRG